eukprot:7876048-Pyramimonas_sp.AAC.1
MESHRGADSRTIQTLHDYLPRMEAHMVTVRDTGIAAARTLHDELLMVRQTPPMEVRGYAMHPGPPARCYDAPHPCHPHVRVRW